MNKELQDDYNEWLLKYGFNPIPVNQLNDDNMYHLVLSMHHYKQSYTLLTRQEVAFPTRITYQLKTPEELQ